MAQSAMVRGRGGPWVSVRPRRLSRRLTRRLQIFMTAPVLVYLFGAVFGHKLYVMAACAFAALGLREWWRSRPDLSLLSVAVQVPAHWPTGQPIPVSLTLESPFPIESLVAELDLDVHCAPGAAALPTPALSLDHLFAGQPLEVTLWIPPLDRGVYRVKGLDLLTAGQMGLVLRESVRSLDLTLVVYPEPLRPRRRVVPPLEPSEVTTGLVPGPAAATGSPHLRPYAAGDGTRRIHWRATARLRELVVRTTRLGPAPRVVVVADLGTADPESILRVAAWLLLDPGDRRPRAMLVAGEAARGLAFETAGHVTAGLEALARVDTRRLQIGATLASRVASLPRTLGDCELVLVSDRVPLVPSLEGCPVGFALAGASRAAWREGVS